MESYASTCIKSRRCKFESYFFDRRRCHNSSCTSIFLRKFPSLLLDPFFHSLLGYYFDALHHFMFIWWGVFFATIKNMSPLKRALSIPHFIANKIVKVTFAIAIHFIFSHLTLHCAYVAIICRFVAFVNIIFATMLHFSIELIFSLCYDEPRTKGGVPNE